MLGSSSPVHFRLVDSLFESRHGVQPPASLCNRLPSFSAHSSSQLLSPPNQLIPTVGESGNLAQLVLARLISVGVADIDASVRSKV